MKLSPNEIAYVAARYWPADQIVTSVAVSLAESGGDTEAMGRSTSGIALGNRDHGLWQASNYWHQLKADGTPGRLMLAGADWRDPYVAARLGFEIWDEARRAGKDPWSPWSVYTSGSYKTYLPDATIAAKAPWAPPAPYADTVDIKTLLDAVASNSTITRDLVSKRVDSLATLASSLDTQAAGRLRTAVTDLVAHIELAGTEIDGEIAAAKSDLARELGEILAGLQLQLADARSALTTLVRKPHAVTLTSTIVE